MTTIGKTANWLLRHSVQRCVKSRRWVCVHARNHTYCSRSCRRQFLPHLTSKVEHLVAFAAIVSNILLRMRRNGYLGTSCKSIGDLATFSADLFLHFICWMSFDSATPISVQSAKFRRFGDVVYWISHFISWKFAAFPLQLYFTCCALRQARHNYNKSFTTMNSDSVLTQLSLISVMTAPYGRTRSKPDSKTNHFATAELPKEKNSL